METEQFKQLSVTMDKKEWNTLPFARSPLPALPVFANIDVPVTYQGILDLKKQELQSLIKLVFVESISRFDLILHEHEIMKNIGKANH